MLFTSDFLSDPETRYCPKCDTPITDPLTLNATGWCKECLARDWRVVSEPIIQDAQHGGVVIGGIQRNLVKWSRSSEVDAADRKERAAADVPTTADSTATIWYHGERSYSSDGQNPRSVSAEQHNALQAFLDKNVALDTKTLKRSGISNVSAVINKLVELFGGGPVRLPSQKGEGYFIRVRSVKKPD